MSPPTTQFELRFGGLRRLFAAEGLARLQRAHVCVIGVGGVGSWAVEALARSGVGALTLIDMDDICVSNVNRQLHALDGAIHRAKVEVMAERAKAINPDVTVQAVRAFLIASNARALLAPRFDYVLDAIDSPREKALCLTVCREQGLPVITSGGAGGRRDPTRIRVADLADASHDRLLLALRKALRTDHGFPPAGQPMGVESVFSLEPPVYPQPDGGVCGTRAVGADLRLDCRSGLGTAAFVTGAFGFAAAARIVARLAEPAAS